MSALLLDTAVFAMLVTDDPRLPAPVRAAVARADRVALSAVSLYEIGQKTRLGEWPEMAAFAPALAETARADGLDLVPLSPAVALAAALMDWDHRDPFDRLLAATAEAEDLTLVSPDAAFDAVTRSRLWNGGGPRAASDLTESGPPL